MRPAIVKYAAALSLAALGILFLAAFYYRRRSNSLVLDSFQDFCESRYVRFPHPSVSLFFGLMFASASAAVLFLA
jgi:hypothetical protein